MKKGVTALVNKLVIAKGCLKRAAPGPGKHINKKNGEDLFFQEIPYTEDWGVASFLVASINNVKKYPNSNVYGISSIVGQEKAVNWLYIFWV